MAHLDIAVLGPFTVTLDGRPLTGFRTDKMRALLAYLAVERAQPHRRAMLAGLLWPELPESAAHHNLSQMLFLLHQLLDDAGAATPFLLATRQTLRFNPASDHTLDVAQFQAGLTVHATSAALAPAAADTLAQAVTYYRGEFLSDLWQTNSQAFEEWALFKRTHYHLLVLDALETLANYALARGEFDLAADYARRQIALEPLREMAHRQLMTALARANRRPEALAHYADCTALLAQELGIAPAPETITLYEQIRAARALEELPPLSYRRRPENALPAGAPPFVGRARELAQLDAALDLALQGQGQLRLITGEAGSGKTALLAAFARRALTVHPDLLLINSSGNAYTGSGDPYWPFLEMLRQFSANAPGSSFLAQPQAARLKTFRAATRAALTGGAPGLAQWLAAAPSAAPATAQPHLTDLITRALLAVAAGQPLVLIVDDAQWADRESLNLLLHLGRRLAGQRLLLLGAARSDALDQSTPAADAAPQPLATIYHELRRYLGDIQLDLAQAEGRPFIDALLDSEPNHLGEAFRETLHRHTGGHALFTTELLRALQERGDLTRDARGFWIASERIAWTALPARVEGVIAARIGQLLPDWQALLTVASVEGDEFTAAVVADVLGWPEAEVCRRFSGALARQHHLLIPLGVQLVGETSLARYRFRHLLFQKYCYNRLDAVEQARLHLRVGRALETRYADRAPEISLALARHFELGGAWDKAVTYLLHAGQHAIQLVATEEALHLLTRGLTLLQRLPDSPARVQQEIELHLALGSALLARNWSAPERARAIERAYELCQRAGAIDSAARSLNVLADVHIARGDFTQAAAIAAQLAALAQTRPTPTNVFYAQHTLGTVGFFRGQFLPARRRFEQAIALYDAQPSTHVNFTGANAGVSTRVWLAQTFWALGYAEQALTCCREAVALARALDHAFSLGIAFTLGELNLRQFRREPETMHAILRALTVLDQEARLHFFQLFIHSLQGWLVVVTERAPMGLAQIQQALQQFETTGAQGGRIYHYVLLAEAQLTLEQAAAALTTLARARELIGVTGMRFFAAETVRLQGEALRRLGRPAEAEACFQEAGVVAREQAAKAWELRAVMSLCRLRQAEGPPAAYQTARAQLAGVYTWFTEGFDTPDLQEAAALLAG